MNARARPIGDFVLAMAGPIIWATYFGAVYFVQALFCTIAPAATTEFRIVGVALTAIAIAAIVAFLLRLRPFHRPAPADSDQEADVFLRRVAAVMAGLSLLAVLWVAFPIVLAAVCR